MNQAKSKLNAATGRYEIIVGPLEDDFAIHVESAKNTDISIQQNSALSLGETPSATNGICSDMALTGPGAWAITDVFRDTHVEDIQYAVLVPVFLRVSAPTEFNFYINPGQSSSYYIKGKSI